MNKTFDQSKDEIAGLCRYFATNRQKFLAPGVKEADVCQSLIEPLFEALGWDVHNLAHVAPQFREVVPQISQEVEGQQKAPDYTFRVGTLNKFYVEAKKCGINATDAEIDRLVYELYGLTEEEIRIVEEGSR
jgi:predicted type IV restriction endonuclease